MLSHVDAVCCISWIWLGERVEGESSGLGLHPPQKNIFWVRNIHLKSLSKTACRGHTVHEYTYAECTARWRGTLNCLTCLNHCNVRTLFSYNWMKFPVKTVGKQYRDSVHVRTFTMMFQCGDVKGKYHCFVHSRILVSLCKSNSTLHGSDGMSLEFRDPLLCVQGHC